MSHVPIELELRGIQRTFKTGFHLDVPAMRVEPGTTLAVLGPSGSGKSTLLEIAGLLEPPDRGEVLVDGAPCTPRDRRARLLTAAVFQRPYLIKATVAENVAYGLRLRHVDRAETARRVSQMLELVGMAGFEDRSAGALSGGEAQRVALARALVLEPRLLTLDEPLASLDLMLRRRMQREFSEILRSQAVTTIYVTHDHDEALVMADRIAVMREGRIVVEGRAEEIVGVPVDAWTAGFFGVEPPLHGVVESVDAGLTAIRVGSVLVYASGDLSVGARVRVGIRPEDVTVWDRLPQGMTSARNRLEMTVTTVQRGGVHWNVVGVLDGFSISASISDQAMRELGIREGQEAVFVFKATAVRVVMGETDAGV